MSSILLKTNFHFWVTFILLSVNTFNLDWSKILLFGEQLCSNYREVQNVFAQLLTNDCINPLPDGKILDWSKLKQSADNNFEFDENSRKISKQVENTVGKGEIPCYEQFLLFPQCFQKTSTADT